MARQHGGRIAHYTDRGGQAPKFQKVANMLVTKIKNSKIVIHLSAKTGLDLGPLRGFKQGSRNFVAKTF